MPEGNFWGDEKLQRRLTSRPDRWVGLMRVHDDAQAEVVASAPEETRGLSSKRIKLMTLLLKAWKGALKVENAVDLLDLIHQAIVILEKGRFISPQKHTLADKFQDISPQHAASLAALRKQNNQTMLSIAGDDWQVIYRFSGVQMSLTMTFHENFGEDDRCNLDTTYRLNSRIGEVASKFIQQNPGQLREPLNSLANGDKKTVTLLDEGRLDALLDKLSGYAKSEEYILILTRYHHMRPASLGKAAARWPELQIDFMTIHVSERQQTDYVIIVGLQERSDGFPTAARESIMEEVLLPPVEDFLDAKERRLMYMTPTRARHQVQTLFNRRNPSLFVDIPESLDVPVARKP